MDYNKNNKDVSGSDLGSDFHPESRNLVFSKNLKKRCKSLGFNYKDLADKIGSSESAIQKWAAGGVPTGEYLILLSKALDCSLDWLLLGEGPDPETPGDEKPAPIYNKDGVTPARVAQPEPEYQKHGGWTPRTKPEDWEMMGKAHSILSSGTMFTQALAANINAFSHALELDQTVKDQASRIDTLEKECDGLKDRLATVEERLKELNPPSIEGQELRKSAAT